MYFKMPCWSCDKSLRVSDEHIGRRARCPYCGSIGEISRPDILLEGDHVTKPLGGGEETPAVEKREGGQIGGTNVALGITAIIGLAGTAVFYLVFIFLMPDNPVRQLFAERGWVPYVVTFFTFWAWAMLVFKYIKLRIQRIALLFDVLPSEVAQEIHPDNVETFRSNILSLPIEPGKSFLIGRVLRALTHYKAHPTRESVATLLTNQSEIDANMVDSSYTMIKLLIWAIPILGFIGTVMGVGQAVGGFSGVIETAETFEAAKTGLGNVTSGLGVAFDTTLLALVLSLFVMFPASAMQKTEEDLLSSVDQYCNENVLRRLHTEGHVADKGSSADPEQAAQAVDRVVSKRIRELEVWAKSLEDLSGKLTQQIAEAWSQVRHSAGEVHREQMDAATDSCNRMVMSAETLGQQLNDAGQSIASVGQMQDRLAQLSEQMLSHAEEMASDGSLKNALSGIENQLARSNQVMESLAGHLEIAGEPVLLSGSGNKGSDAKRWWRFSRKSK